MSNYLIRIIIIIVVILFPMEVFADEQGILDLPDIFVWGEDRSELYGIEDKEQFFTPFLRKRSFLEDIGVESPLKLNPKDDGLLGMNGINIRGGFGTFSDYFYRVRHGIYIKDDWFYNIGIKGSRKRIIEHDLDYNALKGSMLLGKKIKEWDISIYGESISSDESFSRELYSAEFKAYGNIGMLAVEPELYLRSIKHADIAGNVYGANLDLRFPVFNNQWLNPSIEINKIDYKGQEEWIDAELKYINSIFRDFSFELGCGLRNRYGDRTVFNARITGDFNNNAYSLSYVKSNLNYDLYKLSRSRSFLFLDEIIGTESKRIIEFKVIKEIDNIFNVGFEVKNEIINDYLIFINNGINQYPHNFDKKINIQTYKIIIKKEWVKFISLIRNADESIPYLYNEMQLFVVPEINIIKDKTVVINGILRYIDRYSIWANIDPVIKQEIDPYFSFDIEFDYRINKLFSFKLGAENIFKEKGFDINGFLDDEVKYFGILTFNLAKSKKQRIKGGKE